MFLITGGLIGLAASLVSGGRLTRLTEIRFRWPLLVLAALLVKELGILGPLAHSPLTPALFVVSQLALIAWTLWHVRRLRLVWVVTIGMAMNLVVIVANGGHMPVPAWLAHQGPPELLEKGVLGQYIIASAHTHLNWLGDDIRLPGPAGRIFPQAYSPGDLVAFAGMIAVLFLATRPAQPDAIPATITTP